MTKEQILEIMQKHWHQDGYYTADFDSDVCANELLALIEQEKKEVAREILDKIKNCSCLIVHGCNHRCWLEDTIKTIAKEYGVEL